MNLAAIWRNATALQVALAISLAVHAVLLALHFAAPQGSIRPFREAPLDVILVNAHSQEKPERAQALAQASLAGGGGDAVQQGRFSSPLPPALQANAGDAADDAQQRWLEQLQTQQTMLLAQVREQLARLPVLDPRQENLHSDDTGQHAEQRRRLARHLAAIEQRIDEDNAHARRRYVGPATQEAVYAVYYDALKHRIEEKGTLDFPEVAGRKLYGELTMLITVDDRGQVLATRVTESSGDPTLDRRAEAIVRAAGPFGAFDAAMRARADQLLVESRFRFMRDETLSAQALK